MIPALLSAQDSNFDQSFVENLKDSFRSRGAEITSLYLEYNQIVDAPRWKEDPYFENPPCYSMYTRYAFQGGKIMRIMTAIDSPEDTVKRTSREYWDGVYQKQYSPLIARGNRYGEKNKNLGLADSPFEVAMIAIPNGRGLSLERFLTAAQDLKIEKEDNGQIRMESQHFSRKIWLDPEKNFLVTHKEVYYRPKEGEGQEDLKHYTLNVLESKEVVPGLWLPIKWERNKHIVRPAPEALWGEISCATTFEVTDVKVNPDLPDETFKFSFPPGTTIHNHMTNTIEQAGEISKPLPESASPTASLVKTIGFWVILALILLAVLCGALLIILNVIQRPGRNSRPGAR